MDEDSRTDGGGISKKCPPIAEITLERVLRYGSPVLFILSLFALIHFGRPFLQVYEWFFPLVLGLASFCAFYCFLIFRKLLFCNCIPKVVEERPFVAAVSLVFGSVLYVCALLISMEIAIDSTRLHGQCMRHRDACVAFKEFVDVYVVDVYMHVLHPRSFSKTFLSVTLFISIAICLVRAQLDFFGALYFAVTCLLVILKDWNKIVSGLKQKLEQTTSPYACKNVTPDETKDGGDSGAASGLDSKDIPSGNSSVEETAHTADIEIVTNNRAVVEELEKISEKSSLLTADSRTSDTGAVSRPSLMDADTDTAPAQVAVAAVVPTPVQTLSAGQDDEALAAASEDEPGIPLPVWWFAEFVLIALVGLCCARDLRRHSVSTTAQLGIWQASTALVIGLIGSQALLLPYTRSAMLQLSPKVTLLFGAVHSILGMLRLMSSDGRISQCAPSCDETPDLHHTELWMNITMIYVLNLVLHYWSENRRTFSTVVRKDDARSMQYSMLRLTDAPAE